MNAKELQDWIDSLTDDIEFQYRGKWGAICPFNRQNISLCYDGYEVTVSSVENAMKEPFVAGQSLVEICEDIHI